jgi:hypothetical protein
MWSDAGSEKKKKIGHKEAETKQRVISRLSREEDDESGKEFLIFHENSSHWVLQIAD